MRRKIVWLTVSCLMVVSLALASCGPAVTEEEEEEEVVTEEEEVVTEEEEEEEEGPEMVRDSLGKLVEKPQYGGILRLGLSAPPRRFDPAFLMQSQTITINQTNENLFMGDWAKGPAGSNETTWEYVMFPAPEVIAGALAESWERPDDTTLIYHIRQGVHWQDKPPVNGREFVADDVVFTLKRLWETPTSYHYGAAPWDTNMVSIEAPDKYTVVIKTQPGKQGNVYELSTFNSTMQAHEVIDVYGDMSDWKNAVGTGPFMLTDYVDGSSVTFERNPNYWMKDPLLQENQLPYIDGQKWLVIPDYATRLAAMRTAKVDWAFVSWEDFDALTSTTPELQWRRRNAWGQAGINFRVDKPEIPVYDIRVRQALAMAVDQQEIIDSYYGGNAMMITWPVSHVVEFEGVYTPLEELPEATRELFEYHPDKAKQLLVEAGYPDGFKIELYLTATSVDLASIVMEYWAAIGVDLELLVRDTPAYTSVLYGRSYDMGIWSGAGGTYPYINYYSQPGNWGNASLINDPIINQAFDDWNAARFDEPKRRQIMRESAVYKLGLGYILLLPGANWYTFWWPWMKNYHGEERVGYIHTNTFAQYIWLDQDMREEMTGQK